MNDYLFAEIISKVKISPSSNLLKDKPKPRQSRTLSSLFGGCVLTVGGKHQATLASPD